MTRTRVDIALTSQTDGPPHRIALVSGRIAIPPSYFLLDHFDAFRRRALVTMHAQRVCIDGSAAYLPVVNGKFSALRVLRDVLRARPEIVHQHWATWSTAAVLAARTLRVPLVVSVHGYDAYLPRTPGIAGPAIDVVKRTERFIALRSAKAVVVNSDFMRQRVLAMGIPSDRVHIVRHRVDTDFFTPPATGAERAGLLFVGRLSPEKGCELLIRSVALLRRPDAVLTVAGDGPLRRQLERLAVDLDARVRFVGEVDRQNVRDLMRAAAVVVSPSVPARGQVEASGIVPLEAQAAGALSVVTDVGGLPENIPSSYSSLVCEPRPDAVAAAMARALELAGQPGSSAAVREHVVARHAIAGYADAYQKVYRVALGAG